MAQADSGAGGTEEVWVGCQGGDTGTDREQHTAHRERIKRNGGRWADGGRQTVDLSERRKDDGSGGEYCMGGRGKENSADKSDECSGEETEELALEEEADCRMGGGG